MSLGHAEPYRPDGIFEGQIRKITPELFLGSVSTACKIFVGNVPVTAHDLSRLGGFSTRSHLGWFAAQNMGKFELYVYGTISHTHRGCFS
jgi:hypothetical protein